MASVWPAIIRNTLATAFLELKIHLLSWEHALPWAISGDQRVWFSLDLISFMERPMRSGCQNFYRRAFTLVELLVVIGIIAVLIAILLPVLSRSRAAANAVKCLSNLRQIGTGLVMYNTVNNGYIIPAFNLPPLPGSTSNVTGGPDQPMEGWASILDREGMVQSPEQDTNSVFFCPDTYDVEGMKDGQTGTDPGKPRGWTDWPLKFTTVGGDSAPKIAVTMPDAGYNKIIRVSYWLNAYNPIGSAPADIAASDLHYTSSPGLGPDSKGAYIALHRTSQIHNASELIVAADGIYMGRQSVTHLGDANSRIGYRHPGAGKLNGAANVVYADGHAGRLESSEFPRALSSSDSADVKQTKWLENSSGSTVYADRDSAFRQ
jgi:prepilin-type N-terminal cleavage/methylation domain-containing protein/prepilin-type processing-associated H-X9-DG protein